jgi:hypothetical protein
MCARNGSSIAPNTSAQVIPTLEPQSRLCTVTFFYEILNKDGVRRNEEIMKGAGAILRTR